MGEQRKKPVRRRKKPSNDLAVNILTLIVIVLIVFEGRSLTSLFSDESIPQLVQKEVDEVLVQEKTAKKETQPQTEHGNQTETASQAAAQTQAQTEPQTDSVTAGYSDVIVPKAETPVDDSYFADAVFIGDSRMEGFRNQSGITQGTFLTAVGMELENIYTTPYIATAKGNVTVFEALKDKPYQKIYMMIGTNELGTYDFNMFEESYIKVLADIRAIQPEAVIYIYSVIYVEENLAEFDYVNNANVDEANKRILKICREQGYHYINLNEVLSDGNHSLIQGATSDGVHMYEEHLKTWLDYTKSHYIKDGDSSSQPSPADGAALRATTETEGTDGAQPNQTVY